MGVSAEAKRIMVVALGKLYSSRTHRGGVRLHRSLLLTLVMKSARDIYHEAQATQAESVGFEEQLSAAETTTDAEPQGPASSRTLPREEVDNKENVSPTGPVAQCSRKRRGKAAAEPDFLPCKKAKLEQGMCPPRLIVTPVLMDYVNCSSELGGPPTPIIPLQRATAAC